MRPFVAAVGAILGIIVCLAPILAGCGRRAPATVAGTSLPPGRSARSAAVPRDTEMTPTPPGPGSGVESNPVVEPGALPGEMPAAPAGTLLDEMRGVIRPNFGAIRKAVAEGQLPAAAVAAKAIRDSGDSLRNAFGAPTERARLDEFIGYSDDLVSAASKVMQAAQSGDANTASEAAKELDRACGACHGVFRKR